MTHPRSGETSAGVCDWCNGSSVLLVGRYGILHDDNPTAQPCGFCRGTGKLPAPAAERKDEDEIAV